MYLIKMVVYKPIMYYMFKMKINFISNVGIAKKYGHFE